MLRRLFLLLLLAAFASPAAAMPACHKAVPAPTADHTMQMQMQMPMQMPMHGADPHPASDKATPAHACVGCVPIGDWLGARIAVPVLRDTRVSMPLIVRLDLGRGIAPALPPPRRA